MKLNKRSFLAGVLVALILCSVITPVSAASSSKLIEVWGGVSIYVDDEKLNPKDVNGNAVDVFVYNGTTYLPVRAVSEALDKVVQWDGSTRSVYIGKHTDEKPAVWLSDLETNLGNHLTNYNGIKDNRGNIHDRVVKYSYSSCNATYVINGQYTALSGTLFMLYEKRAYTDDEMYIEIYGDNQLLDRITVIGGQDPVDFTVDLTGVLELYIVMHIGETYLIGSDYFAGIADLGLWT